MAQKRLLQELGPLQKEKWLDVQADETDLFRWNIGLWVVNPDSVWHGAYLKAEMRFTAEYPYSPPTFRFLTRNITHPNVYSNGTLCISILHKPGDDEQSGESALERWNVLHGVESVLRSVLLLLDDPEINSPANVDASVLYRDHRPMYDAKAHDIVRISKSDIPLGSRMPTEDELRPAPVKVVEEDADFWTMSDDDEDFGASDSEMDHFEDDDDEDDEEEEA